MKVRLLCGVMLIVALIVTIFCILVGPDRALSEEASPSPSPSATATEAPIVLPTAEQVTRVKELRARVCKVRAKLAKVRRCFGSRAPKPVCGLPLRGASAETWAKVERRLRHQEKDWRSKVRAGRHRMTHPGGTSNGTRWKPLMRLVGWKECNLSHLAYIVNRESSGRARAYNPSGAAGLCQLMPGWYRGTWGSPAGNPFDPEYNLRTALWIYQREGWSPWAL